MSKIFLKVLFGFILCFYNLQSMQITPFVHSFVPGKEDVTEYEIANNGDEHLAFSIDISRRRPGVPDSENLNGECEDESFALYPSQIIIPPKSSRRVKAKWLGNEEFKKYPNMEQAYKVCFRQFPIDLFKKKKKNTKASIEIRINVVALLYMTPAGAKACLEVVSLNKVGSYYKLKLKNTGTKRAILNKCDDVHVQIDGKIFALLSVLSKQDLEKVVFAGEQREFEIPTSVVASAIGLGNPGNFKVMPKYNSGNEPKVDDSNKKKPYFQGYQ